MSAKEMFEELGFKYCSNEEHFSMKAIVVYRKELNSIYFDYDKTIDIDGMLLDMKLLKAINKQVKELNWND